MATLGLRGAIAAAKAENMAGGQYQGARSSAAPANWKA